MVFNFSHDTILIKSYDFLLQHCRMTIQIIMSPWKMIVFIDLSHICKQKKKQIYYFVLIT